MPDLAEVTRMQDELRQREALAKAQGQTLKPNFFWPIYERLQAILKYNYLPDFF